MFERFSPENNSAEARKIKEPPFYALQVYPLTRKNLGGPAIDINAGVVDTGGAPIPGLYAAGRNSAGLPRCAEGYSSGMSIGDATFFGRMAGRSAAQAC